MEVILITKKDGKFVLYPEVVIALKGEIHPGMAAGVVSANPYGKEYQKIAIELENADMTIALFSFLAKRIVGDTYYATI